VAARRRRRATCDGVASWSPTAAGGGRRTTSIIVRRHDAETKSFHEAAATLGEVDRDGRKQAAMASVVAHTVIHSFRGSLGLRLVAGCELRGRRAINTAADW